MLNLTVGQYTQTWTKQAGPYTVPRGAETHTYLINLLDPPVNTVKRPTIGDVVNQEDPL
jgi:hypothetical protein